jgi:hypothetical protein
MKIEINQNEINHLVADLHAFWHELEWCLEHHPTHITITELLDRNRHLKPYIIDDNETHDELLHRAMGWMG